jgi:hypothetical protein
MMAEMLHNLPLFFELLRDYVSSPRLTLGCFFCRANYNNSWTSMILLYWLGRAVNGKI